MEPRMAQNQLARTRSTPPSKGSRSPHALRPRAGPPRGYIVVALALGLAGTITAQEGRWTSLGPPGRVHSLAIHPHSAETIYAGTGAGVFKSVNRGQTWTQLNVGL